MSAFLKNPGGAGVAPAVAVSSPGSFAGGTPAVAGRRPAPPPGPTLNVHIDHLVVDAGIVRNPDHLAPQVEAELARLLEDRGLPDPSVVECEHEAIRAGSFRVPRSRRAEDAAVHIARELYRALRP